MKNYGLILTPRDPLDYEQVLGASKIHEEIRRPDGQWLADLPEGEIQQKAGAETMSCVSFATINCVEILQRVKFNELVNYSDRYLAIASDTTPSGNSPKKVADTLRKVSGVIPEEDLPFADNITSFDMYHIPKPLPDELHYKGQKWLTKYDFGYEWITPTPEEMMKALRYSPLGIAVEAWKKDEKGYYIGGENPNHWTCLVGFAEGDYWIAYDSYPETSGSYIKLLKWDYTFALAMSYSLKKKEEEKSLWRQFWETVFFRY